MVVKVNHWIAYERCGPSDGSGASQRHQLRRVGGGGLLGLAADPLEVRRQHSVVDLLRHPREVDAREHLQPAVVGIGGTEPPAPLALQQHPFDDHLTRRERGAGRSPLAGRTP